MEQTTVLSRPGSPKTAAGPGPATRLLSVDVFRGITMASMVIVNNPGDWGNVYAPLLHAPWNGWTPTDLIFPFFRFIVGLLLTGIPRFPFATWRIPGVLQRIAVCYLVAALLFRTTRRGGRGV